MNRMAREVTGGGRLSAHILRSRDHTGRWVSVDWDLMEATEQRHSPS